MQDISPEPEYMTAKADETVCIGSDLGCSLARLQITLETEQLLQVAMSS